MKEDNPEEVLSAKRCHTINSKLTTWSHLKHSTQPIRELSDNIHWCSGGPKDVQ